MNKWKVSIILKSGRVLKGVYETEKYNSSEAAKELLPEIKPNNMFALTSEDGNSQVLVIVTEVAAVTFGV